MTPPPSETGSKEVSDEKPPENSDEKGSDQATSDSQQSSDVSETGKDPSLQGADGKTTFKPKQLNIGTNMDASQDCIFNEGDGTVELRERSCLDINGSMIPKEGKTYEISLKLSMNEKKSSGWEKSVYMKARIGEEGKYENHEVDLSKLGEHEEVFRSKFQITSDHKNNANKEPKLYFYLSDALKGGKGGLRIHEAIVQEVTAQDSASSSKTRKEDSK